MIHRKRSLCLLAAGTLAVFSAACGSPEREDSGVPVGRDSPSTTTDADAGASPGEAGEEAADRPVDPTGAGAPASEEPPTAGEGQSSGAAPPAPAASPMPLRPPRPGTYVYVRETDSGTKERSEEYEESQKGDDYVVMFRELQFADVPVLSVEAWARSGVFLIQTRIPGITTDWCKWPADNRPKVLPGDLSKAQTLKVDSTCTVSPGEQMTLSGVVEVRGRKPGTDLAVAEAKLTMTYRGPARNASREVSAASELSPAEGLVVSTSGTYSGTGVSRTEFRDRLKR